MKNRFQLVGMAALILAVAGCATEGTSVGSIAPDFPVSSLKEPGKEVRLNDLRGKVVVLDFWATWCGPCRQAMPYIAALNRDYKDKGVVFMSITDEEREKVEPFVKRESISLPIYLDSLMIAKNRLQVSSLPTTVVIDKNGKIQAYEQGFYTPEELAKTLETAIKRSLEG